ncbi:hypothetical protein LFLT20_13910 [Limosilactobacillus fermentum]|nr:hypothetical protein LFLT20_13910 [Limosilactobacillus fermentum]
MTELNKQFLNKIAMIYPTNKIHAGDKPFFHFTYDTLPSVSIIQFNLALAGINIKKNDYILHLKIQNDEEDTLVDTYTPFDSADLDFSGKKMVDSEYGTTMIQLTPPHFTISSKEHLYTATVTLQDSNGTSYDSSSTWFLTRLEN